MERESSNSEGHACRARRSTMGNPTSCVGRDKRVPPKGGPDEQVPPRVKMRQGQDAYPQINGIRRRERDSKNLLFCECRKDLGRRIDRLCNFLIAVGNRHEPCLELAAR